MYSKNRRKRHANIYSKYSRKMVCQKKKRSTKNVAMKGKKGNTKNVIKETRKNKYKSQTKQCNDIVNRQKRNCKKIHAQRKIEKKFKSKKLTNIQCNTQIKMLKVLKLMGHKTVI